MRAGGDMVITQKAPVDDIFDERVVVGIQKPGMIDRSFVIEETWDTMEPARAAYRAAHQGRYEDQSAQLEPFVTTPEQKAALHRLLLSERQGEYYLKKIMVMRAQPFSEKKNATDDHAQGKIKPRHRFDRPGREHASQA